ncbi:hypothetical protein [Nonomuraea roseola]|uniref:Uncharacterized protein n=1 Tax=Nonomuraea roseola TaxID=46179 RepID=A0ABV5Q0R5_9ACTN
MPRKTFTVDYCDYCASEDKEVEATDTIKINGKEALVCDRHGAPVRKVLVEFEAVAAPITQAEGQRPVTPGRRRSKPAAAASELPSGDVIRAWAREENDKAGETIYVVSETGKLRAVVIDAYKAAHGIS